MRVSPTVPVVETDLVEGRVLVEPEEGRPELDIPTQEVRLLLHLCRVEGIPQPPGERKAGRRNRGSDSSAAVSAHVHLLMPYLSESIFGMKVSVKTSSLKSRFLILAKTMTDL